MGRVWYLCSGSKGLEGLRGDGGLAIMVTRDVSLVAYLLSGGQHSAEEMEGIDRWLRA